MHYLFHLLDVDHQGFLTAHNLSYFFDDITQHINSTNAEQVNFQDLKDEIFDMVKPTDPNKITVKDLINRWELELFFTKVFTYGLYFSDQGDTVVSILIEYQRFCAYENRDENRQNI